MDFFNKPMDNIIYRNKMQSLTFPVENIGKTWLCRDIPCIKIGYGERKILIVGPHNAKEWMISQLLMQWVLDIENAYLKKEIFIIYNIRSLCEKNTIYVIPMLNIDGIDLIINGANKNNPFYERILRVNKTEDFSEWQANIRGVDLNLNYNAAWVDGKMNERQNKIFGPSAFGYGGEYPESELETASLCYFTRKVRPDLIYSVQAGNKELYCDFKGESPEKGLKTAYILSRYSDYTLKGRNEGVVTGGGYKNWAIDELEIPALDICVKTSGKQNCEEALNQAYAEVKDLFTIATII